MQTSRGQCTGKVHLGVLESAGSIEAGVCNEYYGSDLLSSLGQALDLSALQPVDYDSTLERPDLRHSQLTLPRYRKLHLERRAAGRNACVSMTRAAAEVLRNLADIHASYCASSAEGLHYVNHSEWPRLNGSDLTTP